MAAAFFGTTSVFADDTSAPAAAVDTNAPAAATIDQRVADLEAYILNSGFPSANGKLTGSPGPGHNAWMMTSTALVLFMTLPGLALFYGGLVRKKNVLSVLAQCLGSSASIFSFNSSFIFSASSFEIICASISHSS